MDILHIINPTYAILTISAIYSGIYRVLLTKFGERDKLKAIQKEQMALNKEFQEAMRSKDDKKIEEMNKKYEEFSPKIKEMIVLMYKPMIIILPLFFIFSAIARSLYPEYTITLPFDLPVFIKSFPFLFQLDFDGFLNDFPHWQGTFGANGWFILSTILISLVYGIAKKAYDMIIKEKNPKVSIHGAQTKDSEIESGKNENNEIGESNGTSKK